MSDLSVMYSSKSDEWETPQHFFDEVNAEFEFDIDACATSENHKCSKYFTMNEDGLSQNWGGYKVWCNPPYSKIADWVAKAFYETRKDNTLVVLLIPSRTDTRYFHDYIYNRAEIRFVKGRLKFGDGKNSAPFPSMLVIFRGAKVKY